MEANATPSRLDANETTLYCITIELGSLSTNIEETMTKRACAGTSSSGLDPKQVVQKACHELMMEIEFTRLLIGRGGRG